MPPGPTETSDPPLAAAGAADAPTATAAAILETALLLGERHGWDAVHLHEVARELGVPLAAIARHYGGKDALAEAWFDRADAALLGAAERQGWCDLPAAERLRLAIVAWLEALAPHRRLTREMLGYKLQPEHLHLQVRGVLRVSATVQWLRETAGLSSTGLRREAEEAVLTGIFLATFARWLVDDSPGASRTQALLARLMSTSEALARFAFER